jgi:hypothetical protein
VCVYTRREELSIMYIYKQNKKTKEKKKPR